MNAVISSVSALATKSQASVAHFVPLSHEQVVAQQVTGIIVCIVGFVIYFLPSFIAQLNKHRHGNGIAVVNIFLGWTLIGWVAALAWSVCPPKN